MFHRRLIHFGIGVKKKKNPTCAQIGDDVHDFVLNFAVCSADFYLCIITDSRSS